MNSSTLLKLASFALFLASTSSHAVDRVSDFSLLDQVGNSHQMSWYDDNAAIALLLQANGSEAALDAIPAYVELQQQYASQGIQFFMINPMGLINRDAVNAEPRIEPPNSGGLVKKDAVIDITLHYTTSGKEALGESEFGLWFYPEDVVPEERLSAQIIGVFSNAWEDIPPYAKNYEMSNSFIIPEDANVYSYHPHMHFRGKDLRMFADYPDGSREEFADYSYAWQLTYKLEDPLFMPKGSKISSIGHFDNSIQNFANPDSSRAVPWGKQSWDEMFFGEIIWKSADN